MFALAGCADPPFFLCNDDGECNDGHCELNGFCSFDDDDCPSGRRYGELAAGGLAGMCVDDGSGTTSGTLSGSATVSTATPQTTTPPPLTSTTGDSDASTSADPGTSTGTTAWWDVQWAWRRTLVVAVDAQQDGPLPGFPVPVRLTGERIDYAETRDGGADVRIVLADSADPLPLEIDEWDPDGDSWLWVRVPELPAGPAELTLHLYYGNPAASSAENPSAVWPDYTAVWHLRGDGVDVSATAATLTHVATTAESAVVGDGLRFAPMMNSGANAGDHVEFDGMFTTGATLSFWMHADTYGANGFGRILDRATGTDGNNGFHLRVSEGQPDGLNFDHWTVGDVDWTFALGRPSVTLGAWHYVSIGYEGGMEPPVVFVDGEPQASELPGMPPRDGTLADGAGLELWIGNHRAQNRTFDGVLDEVRIFAGQQPDGWHRAEYNAMQDELITYGLAEPRP